MKSLQKFNSDHLNDLCSRGISTLLCFTLILKQIHNGIILSNGVLAPFQDSQFSDTIFYQRLLNFTIIAFALIFQIVHLAKQRGGLISKMVIILLLVSFGLNLNTQYTIKSLNYEDQSVSQLNRQEQCLSQSKQLWPSHSQQLYEEASKMNCTNGCPCTSQNEEFKNNDINFQRCLVQEQKETHLYNSSNQQAKENEVIKDNMNVNQPLRQEIQYSNTEQLNSDKQYMKLHTMQKLSEIEQTLQCSGICESQNKYFFWDINQKALSNTSCYSLAVNFVQKDVLQPTKNQSLTILFAIIFSIIQEIFIYKSSAIIQFAKSKLGACLTLPISRSNFTELNNSNEQEKQCEKQQQKVKIHLIDLSKKVVTLKNKDQKCALQIKVSPQLLKSEDNLHSPNQEEIQTPQVIKGMNKISIPQGQN